ncbi:hypothetical protein ABK040_013642 [Willaertia magna]
MIELSRKGIKTKYFSPFNEEIDETFNHLTKQLDPTEERYIHKESQRILKNDKILNLDQLKQSQFNYLILPGGNGLLKNLSNFENENYNLNEIYLNKDLERILNEFYLNKKPIGFLSNSILIGLKALQNNLNNKQPLKLIIGKNLEKQQVDTLNKLVSDSGENVIRESGNAEEVMVDEENLIVTVPSSAASGNVLPCDVYLASEKLVDALLSLE